MYWQVCRSSTWRQHWVCTAKLLSGVTSGVCTGKCVTRLGEGNIDRSKLLVNQAHARCKQLCLYAHTHTHTHTHTCTHTHKKHSDRLTHMQHTHTTLRQPYTHVHHTHKHSHRCTKNSWTDIHTRASHTHAHVLCTGRRQLSRCQLLWPVPPQHWRTLPRKECEHDGPHGLQGALLLWRGGELMRFPWALGMISPRPLRQTLTADVLFSAKYSTPFHVIPQMTRGRHDGPHGL